MGDDKYVCTLDPEAIVKAQRELNEDPDHRLQAVQSLRSKVLDIPGLIPCTDTTFLLKFLRARKFNEDRALQLIKNYYETKKNGVEFFGGLKPSVIRHIIDNGVIDVLRERDACGCRVLILRAGRWDPDQYPMTDIPRALFLVLSRLLKEEETQVHGIHFINDLGGTTWRHARHVSASSSKYFMKILQDVIPLRLKHLNYVREPTFFDVIFAIIKQFMKEKVTRRVGMYGEKVESLHSLITPSHLPTDLGGTDELFAYKEWMEEFLQSDAEVEAEEKYGYVSLAPLNSTNNESKTENAGMQGIQGFFRKLNV